MKSGDRKAGAPAGGRHEWTSNEIERRDSAEIGPNALRRASMKDYLWTSDGQCCANWLLIALQSAVLCRQIRCVPASASLSDDSVSSEAECSAGVKWTVVIPLPANLCPHAKGLVRCRGRSKAMSASCRLSLERPQLPKCQELLPEPPGRRCLVVSTCPSAKPTSSLPHGP
jgi:hypothetical protein